MTSVIELQSLDKKQPYIISQGYTVQTKILLDKILPTC